MRILTIDPGTNTGWAYRDARGRVESGTQVFDVRRGESSGLRFIRFNRWLRDSFGSLDNISFRRVSGVAEHHPQLIIYEQAHLRGGATTDCLVGMTTRLEEYAAEIGAEIKPVHTGTLKKAVTGNGAASKEDMVKAVADWLGINPVDSHQGDALALLRWLDLGMPESASKRRAKG